MSRLQKYLAKHSNSLVEIEKLCIPKKNNNRIKIRLVPLPEPQNSIEDEDPKLHAMKLRLRELYAKERERKNSRRIEMTDNTHTIGNNIIGFVFKKKPIMHLNKANSEEKQEVEDEEEPIIMDFEKHNTGIYSLLNIKKKIVVHKKNNTAGERVSKKKRKTKTKSSSLNITNCCI